MDEIRVLITLNAGILISILAFGYKVIRFFNRMELKTEIMWKDYESRIGTFHYKETVYGED
jgi:hypothetical protein